MGQCPCLLHTGCLSFREHVYWPDGLQGLLWPKQNGFECVEDPHQVRDKVTRILNITVNAPSWLTKRSICFFLFFFLHKGTIWNPKKMLHWRDKKINSQNQHTLIQFSVGFCDNQTLLLPLWVFDKCELLSSSELYTEAERLAFLAHSHIEKAQIAEKKMGIQMFPQTSDNCYTVWIHGG